MATLRSLSLITTLFASAALSQTVLDPSVLPSCALQCPTLNQANSACVPSGGAPVTNQATYQSCFCQSGFLTTLHTTATGICDGVCGTDDATKIQQWYSNLCTSGQVVTPDAGATATTATTLSTSTKSSTSTSTGSSSAAKSSNGGGSWISTHWKWVLCLIIVFLAMLIFGLLGCWLRRRHKRKVDRARASSVAATSTVPSAHSFSNPHLNPPTTGHGLPEMSSAARTRPTNIGPRSKSGGVTFLPEDAAAAAAVPEQSRSKGRATETIAETTHSSKERKRKSRLRK